MALRNALFPWTQKSNGVRVSDVLGRELRYDKLTADRDMKIATNIYNSNCQRSTMQTLSTVSAAATAIQQGSTQVHKLQEKNRKDGKSGQGHDKDDTSQNKDGMKGQDCYWWGGRPAHPNSQYPAKDVMYHNCG